MLKELDELEKAIEGRQFVAHANSILETEMVSDKVRWLLLELLFSHIEYH